MNLELWLAEAFTNGLPSEIRPFVPGGGTQVAEPSTIFAASGDYVHNRRDVQLFGSASTYFRYSGNVNQLAAVSQFGALGARLRLPMRGSLAVTQTATYSPAYLYELVPTATPETLNAAMPVGPAYRTDSSQYRTSVAATFGSRYGTQLTTSADYSLDDFHNRLTSTRDLTTYAAGGKLAHAFSRNGSISIAYHYEVGDFALGEGGVTKEHRITMGLDYAPALSRMRRARFRFELSPTVVAATSAIEQQSLLQGEGGVEYPFHPNWKAHISYRRALEYVGGLSEPALSNGARAEIAGLIGYRLDVLAVAGHGIGSSAISANIQNLGTSTGQVRIRYALTRHYALYAEYLYSSYDLRQAALRPDLPSLYQLHEFRVGFTVFTPVIGK